jgi:glycosyltransferase involved in cell wall biosynthesis
MFAPLLLDLSHTSHTRARTGIQRVTRSLHDALAEAAVPITHDPYRGIWRELTDWERANLSAAVAAAKRGARWPLGSRLRGRLQRILAHTPPEVPENSGLLVPEVFSPETAAALPALFARVRGPRVALFHDAIALKFPELTPTRTVARFPAYLRELLVFDGIAAVSEDSRSSLLDYWRWLGVTKHPPVDAITLGIDARPRAANGEESPKTARPIVLSIGSIEGRKNHLALLEACERLWTCGHAFSLHLIGLAHPQTGEAALSRIAALQASGRPLRYDGPVSDERLGAAYAGCTFTVYPSLMEGFGLPVIESLSHGKPCVCSARGALGESANAGGCVTLGSLDADALASALAWLLTSPGAIGALAEQAQQRRFKTWRDYASEMLTWMRGLPSR